MRALIVEDGRQRGALAASRALAKAGWTVGIASPGPGFASASRSTARRHETPPPEAGEEAFLEAVRGAIDAGGYEVVFGAGDGEVVALSAGRDSLRAVVPYPDHDRVLRAVDKVLLAEAASRVGLAVPETRPADEAALRAIDGRVIVKPRLTTVRGTQGEALRLRAALATGTDEAEAEASYLRSVGAEPLLQRYVPGALTALIALADGAGRLVVTVQQRAEAIWPPEVGGSVRAQTVAVDPRLEELVGKLLAELEWFGLAQVQFQSDGTGEPLLIDLNARFYGSMALALAAGPNLPAIWAALATGRRSPLVMLPRAGVRYHWLEGDLRRALRERRGGLARDLRGTLAYARGAVHGLWDVRDPWPALRHGAVLSFRALRKLVRAPKSA
jgi:predicted ATP-grasp superfamily ATP-dependent carboligase